MQFPLDQQPHAAGITALITEVAVSAVPVGDPAHHAYSVKVAWRGGDRYAVVDRAMCLNTDGGWDYELRPGERDEAWNAKHRFGYEEALGLAVACAGQVETNSLSAVEYLSLQRRLADDAKAFRAEMAAVDDQAVIKEVLHRLGISPDILKQSLTPDDAS